MKKTVVICIAIAAGLVTGLSSHLFANIVPGDCRAPQTCYSCHTPDFIANSGLSMGCENGAWSLTGPMSIGRFIHAGSLLDNGKFMITGGGTPPAFAPARTAEIFNPDTRSFSLSGSLMSDPRWSHVQTTLTDGRVLVVGGRNAQSPAIPGARVLASADIYDPETDTFAPTGPLNVARRSPTATLLNDGKVLIAGGGSSVSTGATMPMNTAEIYDPSTGTFRLLTARMTVPRQYHTTVKLPNGKVLIIGGSLGPGLQNISRSVDIFDPATETFTEVGQMLFPRITQVATLLRDGRVLLAFSWNGIDVANHSEIYDPAANTFTPTAANPVHGKVDLDGMRLFDGTVVCPTGGNEFLQVLPETTIFRPETNDFGLSGAIQFPRTAAARTVLRDGRPLIVGGLGGSIFHAIAEIYTPSVLSQAKGLKNVLSDIPLAAYKKNSAEHKASLISQADQISNKLGTCADCHTPGVKESFIMKRYAAQRKAVVEQILTRMDGCSGGSPSDDWIAGCEDQEQPHAVSNLLLKTLDQILGNALPPVATAEVDQPVGEFPHTVQFTGTASDPDGTVALFFWDFGDGGNSSLQNPTHTYNCPGDYTAVLTAVDNDGLTTQASVLVHVDYTPGITASFNCDIRPQYQAFCAGCHPPILGLNLTTYAGVMAGSVRGPVVIPGDPEISPIVLITDPPRLHAKDVGGEPLSPVTALKQRAWILEGAQNN